MDHQADNPLSDRALEREIETLVSVEPSPEFLARVRTRLAQEQAPSSWRWNWGFAMAGAAAVAVLAVSVWSWTATFAPIEVPQQTVSSADVTREPAPASVRLKPDTTNEQPREEPRVRQPRVQQPRVRSVRLQPDQGSAADEPPFAEVLISENEQRAFAMLLTRIEQGRLPPVPVAIDPTEAIELPALVIPDLVIEPLPQIAALE